MTFIASVIAKNGVAVIADSLVTTSEPVIDRDQLLSYLQSKSKSPKIGLNIQEIIGLFKQRKSYTKDYEEKLFCYDKYTCITVTGSASINDKKISQIVAKIIDNNNKRKTAYSKQRIETRIKRFCHQIEVEVKHHIRKFGLINEITFLVTHFVRSKNKTIIYRVNIREADKSYLNNGTSLIDYRLAEDYETVVCDGQNRISQSILLGEYYYYAPILIKTVPNIIDFFVKEFQITNQIDKDKILLKVLKLPPPQALRSTIKILDVTDLSLQQAADLAALLMRMEIDIQKYTEDIPTVGGVIKLAVIDADGFRFIAGKQIEKPRNI